MKTVLTCLVLATCITSTLAATPPLIQQIELPHHATLYYLPNHHLPMVDINVVFNAGSIYDQNNPGLAALTSRLLDEGTDRMDAREVARRLVHTGAEYGVSTGRLYSEIQLRSLSKQPYLQYSLRVFEQILTKPSFPKQALIRIKHQMQSAIQIANQNPSTVAKKAFFHLLYPNMPYAHTPGGTINGLASISPNQVRSFYKKHYTTANAKIIVVGDVSNTQAKQIANDIIKNMQHGKTIAAESEKPKNISSCLKNIAFPSKQTTVWMGQVGIKRSNKDYFPLVLANEVLGGNQQNARLFEALRNQHGYVYSVHSFLAASRVPGPFGIVFKTKNSNTQDAILQARQVLSNFIKNGMTATELNTAKYKMIHGFYLKLSTNAQLLAAATSIAINQLPNNYLITYRDQIQAVTQTNVNRSLKKYIHPKRFCTVVVGPKDQENA